MVRNKVQDGRPNLCMVNLKISRVGTNYGYGEFIRKLRTHPKLRKAWIEKCTITEDQQIEYMYKHGNNYYVCMNEENKLLGFVGVVDNDLRIAVLPNQQNTGIGRYILDFILKKYPNVKIKVRQNNKRGQKFFESCGKPFTLVE
jgi:ribosomal protein S18 acetylase RimI-like enzyme